MNTAKSDAVRDVCGDTGAGDREHGGRQLATPAARKLVFERQGEFARKLLCCMFDTGVMADVEVMIDDSCSSIRSHAEVLVSVSGYFRKLLQGNPPPQRCKVVTYMIYTHRNERTELCGTISRAWLAAGIKKRLLSETSLERRRSRDVFYTTQIVSFGLKSTVQRLGLVLVKKWSLEVSVSSQLKS